MKMPRSLWHRMTWIVTTVWIVLLVVAVALQAVLPNPQWFLIHIAGLGIIGTSALVWTWHFADALTRRKESQAHQLIRLILLMLGTIFLGVALGISGTTGVICIGAGSLAIIASVSWHCIALNRATRGSFVSPGAVTLRYHLAGGVFLVLGSLFAIIMALDVTFERAAKLWPALYRLHDGMSVAHVFFMVLGFTGLTVLGTLATFGATVARTRLAPGAIRTAMRSLPVLVAAIAAGVAAAIAGQPQLAAVAVFVWVAAGVAGVLVPMFRSWRGSMIGVGDGWTIGAGTIWFEVAALTWAWQLAAAPSVSAARDGAMSTYATLLAAGGLQLILGSLTYLLPVVAGGGPAKLRATIELLEPSAGARFLVMNSAMVAATLPSPTATRNAALLLAGFTALLSFGLLIYAVARQHMKKESPASGVAGPVSIPGRAPAPTSPAGVLSAPAAKNTANSASTAETSTSAPAASTPSASTPATSTPSTPAPATSTPSTPAQTGPRPRPNPRLRLGALAAVVSLVFVGVVSNVASGGSSATPGGSGDVQAGNTLGSNTLGSSSGEVTRVDVSVDGMAFVPNHIDVPAGNRLIVTFTNTGDQRHDLVLSNGAETGAVTVGESKELDAGVIVADLDGWCSMVGHRQMGMTLTISATGGSGLDAGGDDVGNTHNHSTEGPAGNLILPTTAELMADPGDAFEPWDAVLAPALEETTHYISMEAVETEKLIAPGRTQTVWTFNGQTPGPVLHGKVGDTFVVTLTNKGSMGHSIDFHAGDVSPDNMRTIEPGESLTYTFQAKRSGIWMYHCSTMPMSLHIANGMYGAVVIDPPGLEPVDREYVLVQAEQYWGADPADGMDPAALALAIPSAMTFNGFPFQYDHRPLEAKVGERVRIWVLDAGPNLPWAFHVVGTQFDTVWTEGAYQIDRGDQPGDGNAAGSAGAQVLPLLAAQGGFVEFVPEEPGNYAIVNHAMTYAERGAHGVLAVAD